MMKTNVSVDRKTDTSNAIKRRRHARVKINNLISVVTFDSNGKKISQSMGRALNVSQSGLLIETERPLETRNVHVVTADTEGRLVEATGKMAYSRKTDSGMHIYGIRLNGSGVAKKRFVVSLIRVYHRSRKSARVKIAA